MLKDINYPIDLKKVAKHDLSHLCSEIRDFLVSEISKIGGHLGASLGALELTVAIHYLFFAPDDKIVFDTGHQAYVHKILTGRKDKLSSIRQFGGISGFPDLNESEYDCLSVGHSSTSISAGLGFCASSILDKQDNFTIVIIGDGALSAGLAYEALNNAEDIGGKMIIILNDNDMSISRPTGALSRYFSKIASSSGFKSFKETSKKIASFSDSFTALFSRIEGAAKHFVYGGNLFECFGLEYIFEENGNDILKVLKSLEIAKDVCQKKLKPVVLHLKTKKGHGYEPAEKAEDKFHGVARFDLKTGVQIKKTPSESYSFVAAKKIESLANFDPAICVVTPAMMSGSELTSFAANFGDRFFDVGIAEQHALTFASGLALSLKKPFVMIYSTFLQRAFDQLVHDVALQNSPVKIGIDRAGFVGEDGATHHGIFDIAFSRIIPNLKICSPSSKNELESAIEFASEYHSGPFLFRFPRGQAFICDKNFEFGYNGYVFVEGESRRAVLTLGSGLSFVLNDERFKQDTIIDLRFVVPLDVDLVISSLERFDEVFLFEEGVCGGLFSLILESLFERKKFGLAEKLKPFLLEKSFFTHGSQGVLQQHFLKLFGKGHNS